MFKKKAKTPLEAAQATLEEKRQALATLKAELAAAVAEQAAHEAQAAADMAGSPVARLAMEAGQREEAAAAARRLARVAQELQGRIATAEKAVADAEREHVVLLVAAAQAEIDSHELAAAVAMERAMSEMRDAEAAFSSVVESARRNAVPAPRAALSTQVVNVLSAELLKFARQYSRTRGEPPPGVTVLLNTSKGIVPAENERIYIESPYA